MKTQLIGMVVMENAEHKTDLFDEIYKEHYKTVYKYIYCSLNFDTNLADDCIQDVLTLLLQKKEAVINHPNPGGYFIITAKNFINKYKASIMNTSRRTAPFDENADSLYYEENFDKLFEEHIDIEVLKRELLQRLTEKEIELYIMFYEKKQSISLIARSVGISEGNVKVRLFRLRTKVKGMVHEMIEYEGRGEI